MTNDELYLALSQLVKSNSKELESRMDAMENRLSNRIDNLDAEMHCIEKRLSDRIDNMDAEMHCIEKRLSDRIDNMDVEMHCIENRLDSGIKNIKLFLENVMEPRLQNIEGCYTSTFERYKVYAEKYEGLEMDIEVIKSVVSKHNQILCPITA